MCNPALRPNFSMHVYCMHARLGYFVRHTLGGDHDDGTYAVPNVLLWCGLHSFTASVCMSKEDYL